jgi:hypothetical protein
MIEPSFHEIQTQGEFIHKETRGHYRADVFRFNGKLYLIEEVNGNVRNLVFLHGRDTESVINFVKLRSSSRFFNGLTLYSGV